MSHAVITTNALALTYRNGPEVVRDVSIEVRSGQLLCLVGPNGGGKTTLLKCLAGLKHPDEGGVHLNGTPLYGPRALSRWERARRTAVVLTESVSPAYLRVEELVRLGRLPYSRGFGWEREASAVQKQHEEAVYTALEETGIVHLRRRRVGRLSDGERRRVMVARALAQQPRILLLDEPAAHLDPPHQTELFRLLRRLIGERMIESAVVATHLLHLAIHFADELALVTNGTVVQDKPHTLLRSGRIERAFPIEDPDRPLRLDPKRGWFVPVDLEE